MPAWLVEGNAIVYFLLACAGILFLALWWRTRKPKYLLGAGVIGVLLLSVFLLDRLIESDREQIVSALQEMAAGVTEGDYDRVFRHISDSFLVGVVNKSGFRKYADEYSRRWNVTELTIWNEEPTLIDREQRRAEVEFLFKLRTTVTEGYPYFRAQSVFVLDPDGQWRLQSFQVFMPYGDTQQPMQVPGWGG